MPKYKNVYEDLKYKILNGEFHQGEKLPSETQLMRQYGYSRVTINAAMTRLRDMNFISRQVGAGSFVTFDNGGHTPNVRTVALLLPIMIPELVNSLRDALQKSEIRLSLYLSDFSPEKEIDCLHRILENKLDALLCYSSMYQSSTDLLTELVIHDFPVVFLDRFPASITCSSVMDNGYSNMFKAAEMVIAKGHTDIGYVTPVPVRSIQTLQERFNGFSDALAKHGVPNVNNCIISPNGLYYTQKDYDSSFLKLFQGEKKPTAIVSATGIISVELVRFTAASHILIPEEISLVGHDESACGEVTTFFQDYREIGRAAAEIVCKRLLQGDWSVHKIYVPGILHTGSTLLPLRR